MGYMNSRIGQILIALLRFCHRSSAHQSVRRYGESAIYYGESAIFYGESVIYNSPGAAKRQQVNSKHKHLEAK